MSKNRLKDSLSPYLLQHQDNPVQWYPWSEEALQTAHRKNQPIFLSIGYAACHWCHVMEKESFEDQEIANLLNEYFISIKVDREERPDIDQVYMDYVVGLTGHGGWPMSVFMTPDLHPFFAGMYFPPTPQNGSPSFKAVLLEIIKSWQNQQSDILLSSKKIYAFINEEVQYENHRKTSLENILIDFTHKCVEDFDDRWGGFGTAPKFPQSSVLSLLMRQYHKSCDIKIGRIITYSLEQMARGGIYDQIGGGFHRYSTDERWLIPHFEKMLYDNALLSRLYLEAYQLFQLPYFLKVGVQIVDYLIEEMQNPQGGFYSSEDADTEGQEGKYYIWNLEEIQQNVSNLDLFYHVYGIDKNKNYEEGIILYQATPLWTFSKQERHLLDQDRNRLLYVRRSRTKPYLDDKILTDWNALVVSSLTKAYQITSNVLHLQAAYRTIHFIENHMLKKDHLYHMWRNNVCSTLGFLEDYTNFILALLDIYECDFNQDWIYKAERLLKKMIELFWDEQNKAFFTASLEHATPLTRKKTINDDPKPSGNAQAAIALIRLGSYLRNKKYDEMAHEIILTHALKIQSDPVGHGTALCALDNITSSMQHIIFSNFSNKEIQKELLQIIYKAYLPYKAIARCDDGSHALPITEGRQTQKSEIYICQGNSCSLPLHNTDDLHSFLRKKALK